MHVFKSTHLMLGTCRVALTHKRQSHLGFAWSVSHLVVYIHLMPKNKRMLSRFVNWRYTMVLYLPSTASQRRKEKNPKWTYCLRTLTTISGNRQRRCNPGRTAKYCRQQKPITCMNRKSTWNVNLAPIKGKWEYSNENAIKVTSSSIYMTIRDARIKPRVWYRWMLAFAASNNFDIRKANLLTASVTPSLYGNIDL